MIGYVLLVTIAIIISALVYNWLRGYVPKEALQCPEGVSFFIEDYNYNCTEKNLTLKIKNNGRFSISGYYIYATNSSAQELAAIDLTPYFIESSSQQVVGGAIMFLGGENLKKPGDSWTDKFDLSGASTGASPFPGQVYSIEIIPARSQLEKRKMRFVSCGNAKLKQKLNCAL